MSHTRTYTYSTLEISKSSFDDIKARLEKAGVLNHYIDRDRTGGEMILFGDVGLLVDKTSIRTDMRSCCKYHGSSGPAGTACSDQIYTEVR